MTDTATTKPDRPVAATNEGEVYLLEWRLDAASGKSQITPDMIEAFRAKQAEAVHRREEAAIARNDRAFRELSEREKDEADVPARLTRPQFFED